MAVRKWVVCIPQRLCILKRIDLPACDIGEATAMIEFELSSLVPLEVGEIEYGCTLLEEGPSSLSVLVWIVKKKAVEQIVSSLIEIGLNIETVVVDSAAIAGWFQTGGKCVTGTVINVVIDNGSSEILVCSEGNFQWREQITGNAVELAERIQELCEDIDDGVRITIAGNSKITTEIEGFLNEQKDGLTIEVMEITDQLGVGVFDKVTLTGAIAAAKSSRYGYLNLLPSEILRKRKRSVRIRNITVTGLLSLFCIFFLWLSIAGAGWRIEKRCRIIEDKIAPIEHIAESVQSKREILCAIGDQMLGRDCILRIFGQLYRYTPTEISISELGFSVSGGSFKIDIRGQAGTLSDAFEYSNKMNFSKLLAAMQIVDAQQVRRPGGSVVEFKANCVVGSK